MTVVTETLWAVARGLPLTIGIWLASVATGLLVGVLVACLRHFGPALLNVLLATLVEIVRGVPFVVQAFLLYYGGPFIGLDLTPVVAGWLALSIYAAAYFSEVFRGGFLAIPPGHVEAARLLGLKTPQTITRILLPEMALSVLPSLANLAVILVKETAILSIITVPELTFTVSGVGSATFAFAQTMAALALSYWLLVELTAYAARRLERGIARATLGTA
ncbi:polar amino acid transport system permease protein [Roseomonas rosea]|uniref:Polar amino acid transport system permease protein n=1 Tax=Muricoccus roseus TaxID=198092 RepID=A0A1M6H432_9PROT|nr:amino acid ABC transporter permease [Roseomonas rosea]SHJ16954.1 polar amino acid transport system permease protein [Roseomonas rosea]